MASRVNHLVIRNFSSYKAYKTAVEPVVNSIQEFVTEELELRKPDSNECDCVGICTQTANMCLTKKIPMNLNLLEDPHLPIDQFIVNEEIRDLIEWEIKKLPSRQSLVLALLHEGEKIKTIAQQLGISHAAVSERKKRGIINLRRSPVLRQLFKTPM